MSDKEPNEPYPLSETEKVVIGRVACNMRAAGLLMVAYGVGFLLMDSRRTVWACAQMVP